MSSDSEESADATQQENRIPTIDPEKEPEYVGVHSGIDNDRCENWVGETTSDIEQCGNEATHTVVMYFGKLHEIALCDGCGEPEDVDSVEREWSGR